MIHSHWTAVVVLAVIIFSFDNIRQKRPVPLTTESGIAGLKNSAACRLDIAGLDRPGVRQFQVSSEGPLQ